jgi:hypothetical protein
VTTSRGDVHVSELLLIAVHEQVTVYVTLTTQEAKLKKYQPMFYGIARSLRFTPDG